MSDPHEATFDPVDWEEVGVWGRDAEERILMSADGAVKIEAAGRVVVRPSIRAVLEALWEKETDPTPPVSRVPAYCRSCDHTHIVGTPCWFASDRPVSRVLECLCGTDDQIARGDTTSPRLSIYCPKHDGSVSRVVPPEPRAEQETTLVNSASPLSVTAADGDDNAPSVPNGGDSGHFDDSKLPSANDVLGILKSNRALPPEPRVNDDEMRCTSCDQPVLDSPWCLDCVQQMEQQRDALGAAVDALGVQLGQQENQRAKDTAQKLKELGAILQVFIDRHKAEADAARQHLQALIADLQLWINGVEWNAVDEHVRGCCHFCFRFPVEGHESDCAFLRLTESLARHGGTE